jgi:hypothetical protein
VPTLGVAAELGGRFVPTNVYAPDPAFAIDGLATLEEPVRPFGLGIALDARNVHAYVATSRRFTSPNAKMYSAAPRSGMKAT